VLADQLQIRIDYRLIIEAFGNAQTIMNDNSSRFAKFLELSFEGNGQVLGGKLKYQCPDQLMISH
jgi:hypothetical protein